MKKANIDTYFERGRGELPAVYVKADHFGRGLSAETLNCSEETFEKAMQYAYDMAVEGFWESDAPDICEHHLGKGLKVYAVGRSNGHLVIEGLPPVEDWDAIRVSAWGRFEKAIRQAVEYRCSAEVIREDIEANRWNEEGAEMYNFFDKKDGSTVCIAELKQQAKAAGFAPVIR